MCVCVNNASETKKKKLMLVNKPMSLFCIQITKCLSLEPRTHAHTHTRTHAHTHEHTPGLDDCDSHDGGSNNDSSSNDANRDSGEGLDTRAGGGVGVVPGIIDADGGTTASVVIVASPRGEEDDGADVPGSGGVGVEEEGGRLNS